MKQYPSVLCAEEVAGICAEGCQIPGCKDPEHDNLVLKQHCHPGAGTDAVLQQHNPTGQPIITIRCRKCEAFVVSVLVGKENP